MTGPVMPPLAVGTAPSDVGDQASSVAFVGRGRMSQIVAFDVGERCAGEGRGRQGDASGLPRVHDG